MTIALLTEPGVVDSFIQGLKTTLYLSGLSATLALLLGLAVAFVRVSECRPLRFAVAVYVEIFRNTPLLIQLYIYYRGLQGLGVTLSPETCGMIALSLYTGAYLSEVFRSGLLAIPREQTDAGLSLGLNRFRVYQMILMPQALRIVLPAVGNQLISLVKNSSLVAFITVTDLFFVVYKGAVDHFKPMEYFIVGGAMYLTLSLLISLAIRLLERLLPQPPGESNTTRPSPGGAASYG